MSWLIEEQIQAQASSNDIDLLIATPSRDGKFSQHWVDARLQLEMPPGKRITATMETGQPVDISRNISITKAFQNNAKHILFWDGDVIPPKHTLNTLLQLNLPVVGAVYRSRGPPFQILAAKDGNPLSEDLVKQPLVIEVDTIGAGFLLVDCRVLEKYSRKIDHWQCLVDHRGQGRESVVSVSDNIAKGNNYHCPACDKTLIASFFDYRPSKTRKLALSEDYYFCYKVKELGFKIMAATIVCNHEAISYVGQEPELKSWLTSAADVK